MAGGSEVFFVSLTERYKVECKSQDFAEKIGEFCGSFLFPTGKWPEKWLMANFGEAEN